MPVPTIDELTEFIEDPLRSKLQANRKIRRKNRRRNGFIMAIVVLLFLPAAIAATIWHGSYGNEFLGGLSSTSIPILLALVFAFLYMPLRLRFSSDEIPFEYTPDIVVPLVHFIDPRLTYRPDEKMQRDDIVDAALAPSSADDLDSRHLFEGKLRDIQLRLAQVDTRSKGAFWRRKTAHGFCGLLMEARFSKPFATTVSISRRGLNSLNGNEGQSLLLDGECQRVTLGEKNFDTEFEIRSRDPEAARQLLSPSVREYICALDEAFSGSGEGDSAPWELLMRDNRLFLAYQSIDYFDRSASRFSLDTGHLHRIGRQLRAAVDLVELLAYLKR